MPFVRDEPLTHRLASDYAALRAIRTRRQLLQSPLWARVGAEVERVTHGVERADHLEAAARGARERGRLRVVAWNIQRGMRLDGILQALGQDPVLCAADVLLLVEVDHGMARSGNRNVARELAEALGMNYAFAVSYLVLEDDFGENPEGRSNGLALAGAAILSRVPIGRVENVDVPELRDKFSSSEKRLGRKRALAAELLLPEGPLAVVTCHLDSNASSAQRARQLAVLLDRALAICPARALVGGDFNTTTYDASSPWALARDLLHKLLITGFRGTVDNYLTPERRYELPVFATLAEQGFAIDGFNDRALGTIQYDLHSPYAIEKVRRKVGGLLTRWLQRLLRPWGGVVPARLDWFAGRGLTPRFATVVAPRDPEGRMLSDHAAVVVDVVLGEEAIMRRVFLFACVHNAGRSQMSAALFNALADPAKAHALSAGTEPGTRVHPEVVAVMRERGIDLAGMRPQKLTPALAATVDWLITMGCGDDCPVVPGLRRDDWPLPDPKGQPPERVRAIRDEIERRVKQLVRDEGLGR